MKNRPEKIKNALFTIIRRLCADQKLVARDPEKDFTRRRKLWPERLVKLLLAMGGGNLSSGLLEHFNYSADTPSASAFTQQRAKLRPELLEQLFQTFQLPFRIVRFKLTEDAHEILITNLAPEEFPLAELKKLYAKRWGVETSFRELSTLWGYCIFIQKRAGSSSRRSGHG